VLKIGVLLGDDIGLEVVPECVKVIKAAAARTGLAVDWRPLPIGRRGHEEHGDTLPAVTEQALRDLDGWIMGPIGHAAYPRNDGAGDPRLGARHCRPQHRQSLRDDHVGPDARRVARAQAQRAARDRRCPTHRGRGGTGRGRAKYLTPDLGGTASTQGMGDAIAAAV
jgi:isocitrate/isopropylmalate dehydrogenase